MSIQRLQVEREGEFSYPLVFSDDFTALSSEVSNRKPDRPGICIVTDCHVAPLYLQAVKEELETCSSFLTMYVLPAGEEYKNLDEIRKIYTHLIELGFGRKDLLVALGGGVVGDMTGFAAATYLRGIDFIQIPTTLLAQVDSSIGGKTGVDLDRYKNMVGAFHQPSLVYMNAAVFSTLPDREFSCGMGEILKHGLIKDAAYLEWLADKRERIRRRDPSVLNEMILKSCRIKKEVVEQDPTEQGIRRILNFGHTVGHAVEKLKQFELLHGQCVSIGMVAAAYLSMKRGCLTRTVFEQIKELLTSFDLPVYAEDLDPVEVLKATKSDKKMVHGRIRFILLKRPGLAYVDNTVTDRELLEAIKEVIR